MEAKKCKHSKTKAVVKEIDGKDYKQTLCASCDMVLRSERVIEDAVTDDNAE